MLYHRIVGKTSEPRYFIITCLRPPATYPPTTLGGVVGELNIHWVRSNCACAVPLHLFSCTSSAALPQLHLLSCTCAAAPPELHLVSCTFSIAPPELHLLSCTSSAARPQLHLLSCSCSALSLCKSEPAASRHSFCRVDFALGRS